MRLRQALALGVSKSNGELIAEPTHNRTPRPKSWDEFVDICEDMLKRVWKDPYLICTGSSSERQYMGMACDGYPEHLNGARTKKYAKSQRKETNDHPKSRPDEVPKSRGIQS